jgi:hypothetical protein
MTVDQRTGEIEVLRASPGGLAFAYSPEQLKAQMAALMEMRKAVLVQGTDFDTIPGTNKPSLYKPGAEKLVMVAGLAVHEDSHVERNAVTGEREGLTARYTMLRPMPGARWKCGLCGEEVEGIPVGQSEGYAGYDEDRFYKSAALARADAESRERFNAQKYERSVNPAKWDNVEEYRAPWNSVLKMAQKRGFVGTTLNALSASGLFTQDVEDVARDTVAGEAFDPMAHLGPHLGLLVPEELARLRDWREEQQLSAPRSMTQLEVSQTLLQIAVILAGRQGTPTGQDGTPTGQDDGRPFEAEPVQPPLEAHERPVTDVTPSAALNDPGTTVEAPQSAPQPLSSAEASALADFDERTAPAEDARARASVAPGSLVSRGRALQLHRKAGAIGLNAEAQKALVLVSSEGRTEHASELSEEEIAIAETLLTQIESGLTQTETLVAAAEDYVAARAAR